MYLEQTRLQLFEEKESAANQNQIEEQNIKHENLPNIEYLVLETKILHVAISECGLFYTLQKIMHHKISSVLLFVRFVDRRKY